MAEVTKFFYNYIFSMVHNCWSCSAVFPNKDRLRNHYMNKPHRFLEVVCAWCCVKFRRPIDLRAHLGSKHRDVVKVHGNDFPSDREAFFAAVEPRAFRTCMKGTPLESPGVIVMKEQLLKGNIRTPEAWQRGWERHGPLSTVEYSTSKTNSVETGSYSPTKPEIWTVQSVEIGSFASKVVVYGGTGAHHRLTLESVEQRCRDRLMRVMGAIRENPKLLPKQWSQSECTTDVGRILKAVGLEGITIIKTEVNRWKPADLTSSPPRKRLALSPVSLNSPFLSLSPLLTPLHEPVLDYNFSESEFPECTTTTSTTTVTSSSSSSRTLTTALNGTASTVMTITSSPPISSSSPVNKQSSDVTSLISTAAITSPVSSSKSSSTSLKATTSTRKPRFSPSTTSSTSPGTRQSSSCVSVPAVFTTSDTTALLTTTLTSATVCSSSSSGVISSASSVTSKKTEVISSMDSASGLFLPSILPPRSSSSVQLPTEKTSETEAHTAMSTTSDSDKDTTTAELASLLLLSGNMPLFPPARRDWNSVSSISLPLPGPLQAWPPADWRTLSPDNRLLMWQTVSTSLAIQWNMPLDRSFIMDAFQFLALPGTKESDFSSTESHLRHTNYSVVRKIAQKKPVVGSAYLIAMYESGYPDSFSAQPGPYRDFIVSLNRIPVRI